MRDPHIFRFNEAKPAIVAEVVRRVVDSTPDHLLALNDAAYLEIRRLGGNNGASAEWRYLAGHLGRMSDGELRDKLRVYAERYAWDVAGNFDRASTSSPRRAMAPLLGALMSPRTTLRNLPAVVRSHGARRTHPRAGTARAHPQARRDRHRHLHADAPVEPRLGRVRLRPRARGPAARPPTAPARTSSPTRCSRYFMHNLGAYRVDRRLRTRSTRTCSRRTRRVLLERGYHSLFFPGGTRSRSGGVERKLKLGLAGTGIEAFVRTTAEGGHAAARLLRAGHHQLPAHARGRDAHRRLPPGGRQGALHHRGRRVDAHRPRRRVHAASCSGSTPACVIRFSRSARLLRQRRRRRGRRPTTRAVASVDAATYVTGATASPRCDAARDAAVHARARRVASSTRLQARHGRHGDARRGGRARSSACERAVGKADLFAVLRHRDDVTVSRAELAEDVETCCSRALAVARGPGRNRRRRRAPRQARRRDPGRRAPGVRRATTRTRCSSPAAPSSSFETRASSSITRTAWRPTGWPSTPSKPARPRTRVQASTAPPRRAVRAVRRLRAPKRALSCRPIRAVPTTLPPEAARSPTPGPPSTDDRAAVTRLPPDAPRRRRAQRERRAEAIRGREATPTAGRRTRGREAATEGAEGAEAPRRSTARRPRRRSAVVVARRRSPKGRPPKAAGCAR